MSTRVVDRIDGWDDRQFADGLHGLARLLDREFSGVVRAGGVELFLTQGVAVSVRGGAVDEFEGLSGTAYEAPSPALPLLAVMQMRSETVREEFYTERTALSEVHQTLSEGGFTGYVELSENVLSGDYYLVYHGGESMPVAFVGQSAKLLTGDRALETAADEVGLYEVRPVPVEPLDLPRPEPERAADSPSPERPADTDDTHHTVPSVDPARTSDETGSRATDEEPESGTSAGETAPPDTTPAGEKPVVSEESVDPDAEPVVSEGPATGTDEETTGPGTEAVLGVEQLRERVRELEREQATLRERLATLRDEHSRLVETVAAQTGVDVPADAGGESPPPDTVSGDTADTRTGDAVDGDRPEPHTVGDSVDGDERGPSDVEGETDTTERPTGSDGHNPGG
jgi:hypothetical protein